MTAYPPKVARERVIGSGTGPGFYNAFRTLRDGGVTRDGRHLSRFDEHVLERLERGLAPFRRGLPAPVRDVARRTSFPLVTDDEMLKRIEAGVGVRGLIRARAEREV